MATSPPTRHSAWHPTRNWPASSLTITVPGSRPCALIAPQSAPSVAMRTGSGLTLRSVMPSRSRCATIADAAGPQNEVLNEEICVALEPRAEWHRDLDNLVFNGHSRRHRATAALGRAGRLWLASLLHPTRFERWPTLQPFEPRDLLALGCHRLLQTATLAQQPDDTRLQLSRGECVQVIRGSHPSRESEVGASGKRKQHCRHRFCRCYDVFR